MTLTWKDALATLLTALVVLTFVAAHESWDVWLIGSSYRWAALAVTLLGAVTCALGSASEELGKGRRADATTKVLAAIGALSGLLAIWAIVAGSLTALSLLVVSTVVLWAGATIRHAGHPTHHPLAT